MGTVSWCVVRIVAVLVVALALGLMFMRLRAAARETEAPYASAPRDGFFVRAADLDVFVQQTGPADGPAVLFVHGTGAWSATWRESLDALGAAGYRAIAIDLPPFGYSQRPASADYSKPAQARRIVGVLDALGVERGVLVGHSFGAGATVEAALAAPQRIRALVLVDAALAPRDPAETVPKDALALRAFLAARPLRDAVTAAFLTNPAFTQRLLAMFVADARAATRERAAIYAQPLALRGTTQAVGAWLPSLLLASRDARSDSTVEYAAAALPVRLIWGSADSITPLSAGERLAKLFPDARLARIDGVGHIPQIEAPERFRLVLLDQIDDLHRSPR